MPLVYRHRRLDNNQVFYIGIGTEKRAYRKQGRNNLWKRVVNKYGYSVEILAKDLSWENACELETLLIEGYGRVNLKTGNLVNMTIGGDGIKGFNHSEDTKLKMSVSAKKRGVRPSNYFDYCSRKLINIKTNKIYNSITSASKEVGIKRTTLNEMLCGTNKNKTNLRYLK